jgi:FKBP-type peptidyl-prolyl cis-trans isomerase
MITGIDTQLITRNAESLVRKKQDKLRAQTNDENKAKGSEFLRNDARYVAIFITNSDLQYYTQVTSTCRF